LIEALYEGFAQFNTMSPPRLNFAGGEPLLYGDQVVSAMARARELGFDVSLISNGSRLTADLAARIAPHLTILGISIDATTSATNERIGRLDGRGIQLDLAGMIDHIAFMRSLNPAMTLKVNTVVNEVNWQEDLTSLISDLEPTRWKVLRMLPVVTKELALNDDQFQAFVDRHHILDSIMCVEGNDDMVQSYIMVDPHGRFFQNRSVGAGYDYSPLIIDMGALEAFDCMTWSAEKFVARYPRISK
jgi:radical S-adenosyl methionine domain-containing protein 2